MELNQIDLTIRDLQKRETASRYSQVINSLDGLESTRSLWTSLILPSSSPFQTYAWNRAWYENYANVYDEIIVFLAAEGRALFPLYRKGTELHLAGDQTCDFQDVIARSGKEVSLALDELKKWARKERLNLLFLRLSTEGLLYRELKSSGPDDCWLPPIEKYIGPCPWMKLDETSESTLAHLPRKYRAELRRQLKRTSETFPQIALHSSRAPEIAPENLDEMISFHRKNFHFKGENPLDDPRLVSLLAAAGEDSESGLRVTRFGNDTDTLAMDLTFVRGGRFYGFLTAFAREHGKFSPGTCLMVTRLEELIHHDKVRVFDFLCGSESYKYRFATEQYSVRSVRLYAKSVTGLLRRTSCRLNLLLRSIAKRIVSLSMRRG